jgi:hypothetical protein
VPISKEDHISGRIFNGHEGKIEYVEEKMTEEGFTQIASTIVRFDGSIDEPVIINGMTRGVRFHLGKDEYILSVSDTIRLFKDVFYLQAYACQRL